MHYENLIWYDNYFLSYIKFDMIWLVSKCIIRMWYDMISFKMHYQNVIWYDKFKNDLSEIDMMW